MCVAQTTLTEINIQRLKYLEMKLHPTKLQQLYFTVGPKIADSPIFFSSPSTISNHKKIFSSTGIIFTRLKVIDELEKDENNTSQFKRPIQIFCSLNIVALILKYHRFYRS